MGYDMRMVVEPTTGDGYLQLNLGGMGRLYEAMQQLGMLYDSRPPGPWPPSPGAHIEEIAYQLAYGEPTHATSEELRQARDYTETRRRHLRAHPRGGHAIPGHKFFTNDGWIVTPDEIKAALSAYEAAGAGAAERLLSTQNELNYWDRWIAYLRRAVDHEGFEVH
ncbi:MAG: hypothetical protein ACRDTM_12845 [Micromonosporaceae bacterium]